MCGPAYEIPSNNSYRVALNLERYYDYQKNHRQGETEKEFLKRRKNENKGRDNGP